ncbi:hypothetical protein CCR85_03725 [Rhodothalassium salexigens]|uniref:M14 family zinc carboxypeptidase n=1 Tax=Rhodothalassium salexigens TaxID=1086 RepID=UPI0019137F11|nr:M14 family zinc carboxypeptidase [Rhodothalassium salexigens]MBK5910601.1 hypothetical protein [Rhodothalassium salexigens]MBK5920338.1 hypothetical protein [Rhodothalassium salexigens]
MRAIRPVLMALAALAVVWTGPAGRAVDADFYFPGADYDPAVPTLERVIGHAVGEDITKPGEVLTYLRALAEARPDSMRIVRYAESWEGRPLVYAIIAKPETMARLDAIRGDIQAIADPRKTDGRAAAKLIETLPATTWLSYAVHGNEISSTDAAVLTAYHLLASRGDERVAQILDNSIVFIDPMQNPDGRARFIHTFEQALGLQPMADRRIAEHDEPWPGGRGNHYLFDLNRDWIALTQPETRGKVAALLDWLPLSYVDAHEMGGDSTYYFAPSAEPINLHQPRSLRENKTLISKNTAAWFDRFGIDYFTREVFDSFYPGYGDTWPSYYGSLSQTYEQASARGLVFRQDDGDLLTYAEGVRNHFLASLSAAEVTSRNRARFWDAFYDFRLSAVEEGRSEDVRSFVLPAGPQADVLAALIAEQGIEVGRATADFRACRVAYPSGSYVVDLAQPQKRLARVLLDRDIPVDEEFMVEQQRRRAKGLDVEMYDVTAWSLPLLLGAEAVVCGQSVDADTVAVDGATVPPGTVANPDARVAFLVPWGGEGASKLLGRALADGLSVMSTDLAFTHDERGYPRGTLIFKTEDNAADLPQRLARLAAETGADVIGVDSSWVTEGPNFGSRNVRTMKAPRVAIAWDDGTSSYSAGNTRYVLERRYGYPVAPLRVSTIARAGLEGYDVLILPSQGWVSYGQVGGERLAGVLRDFVGRGGVVIGLGAANRFLGDPEMQLMGLRREIAAQDEEAAKATDNADNAARVPGTEIADAAGYDRAVTPDAPAPERLPGAILRAEADPDHWMAAGLGDTVHALVEGRDIYAPLTRDQGTNVVRFVGADAIVASGVVWDESAKQLAYKPLMAVEPAGRGYMVAITQDIAVRGYQRGLDLLLVNAVFRGAAHARPLP